MKIAIFSPYATVVPHFETELEIAQVHLDGGDQVEFISCMGGLANCDFNTEKDAQRCRECIGRREMGLELLTPKVKSKNFGGCEDSVNRRHNRLPILGGSPVLQNETFSELNYSFTNFEDLKNYRIENFDIGFAVLSSLVSHCHDPEPDLIAYRDVWHRLLTSAYQTYRQTGEYIKSNRPDRIYVFNGRFAAMRAVFRAAEHYGVDCFLHERGCDGQHYAVTPNHLPHDITAMQRLIREHWENHSDNDRRTEFAEAWFHGRRKGVERTWHSFVKGQEPEKLPPRWDSSKRNIAIFSSSDEEFVAIGDCWVNSLYPDQTEGLARISQSLLDCPELHITLRMHPNLCGVDHRQKQAMQELNFRNLTVIPPDSKVDSYALLLASDTVATFGSTIGIEAVFWNRPSVLLGPSFYHDLGGTYQPATHQAAVELLTQTLPPQSRQGALMYGFWQQTNGIPFQYTCTTGLFEGQFKSQTLYARPPKKTLGNRIRNELRRAVRWFNKDRRIA
jgi:hypothetical protein